MKQKDLALIIVIVFISAVSSLLLFNLVINSPNKRRQEVEVVEPITEEFKQASEKYFNETSINPTQLIQIGENQNQSPFTDN